jgi:hypothetical protein
MSASDQSVVLLPCPFCGVVPESWTKYRDTGAMDGHRVFVVECVSDECGIRPQVVRYGPSSMTGQPGWVGGMESDDAAKRQVETLWNTRLGQ